MYQGSTEPLSPHGNIFLPCPSAQTEVFLYGSERIGTLKRLVRSEVLGVQEIFTRAVGLKTYELKDHLGNVRVAISDVKIPDGNGLFRAEIASYNNYYPFGMVDESRSWAQQWYRYGYNGKEKDDEIKGAGNSIDFGARIYDPRLGRFLSRDRFAKKYPYFSEYIYASNQPITHIDDNGDYAIYHHYAMTKTSLEKMGVSALQSRLIAHYASVYADNPAESKQLVPLNRYLGQISYPGMASEMNQDIRYKQSIIYTGTDKSQNTDPIHQAWHGCMGLEDKAKGLTAVDAMKRSATFAWDKLFSSTGKGDLRTFGENSEGIQELGQALHAWQDIFAHAGVLFVDGSLDENADPHDEVNDIFPRPRNFGLAKQMTDNLIRVHQVLTGNFSNVANGQQFVTLGMSSEQTQILRDRLTSGGFSVSSNSKGNLIANTPRPE